MSTLLPGLPTSQSGVCLSVENSQVQHLLKIGYRLKVTQMNLKQIDIFYEKKENVNMI